MRRGTALLASLAALCVAAPAQAADYVGLGDSYSSGNGTAGSYSDNCQRTTTAYPVLIDAQLPGTGVNLSCGGARTNHITADPQTPGNAQPQVDIPGGLGPDTDYVTLEIGGNDVGFVDVLTECGNPFGDCDARVDEAEQQAETELPPKLDATYAAVRSKAPNAVIAVVGYPRIFRPNQDCNTFFSAHEVNRLNAAADQLDELTRTAAHARDLAYVSAIPVFIGHGACDSVEWINGLSFSTPGNSYHPKAVGHTSGYAPVVLAGIQNVPNTTIGSPPPNPSNNPNPQFQLTSTVANSTFQCKLDGGAYSPCSSPKQYTGLGQGSHTLIARAVNSNGDVDQTPTSYTWTIDTTTPTVSISDGPSGTESSADASFQFATDDASAALECKLDSGIFEDCASPKPYTGLADGSHTFTVRATDPAGNAVTASRTWTVDTTAPVTTLNATPPDPTTSPAASFEFALDDPDADAECSLDGGEFEPCSSPADYLTLSEGNHTFQVRGVDAVGNIGNTESYTWTVDFTASTVTIDSGPPVLTNEDEAEFDFTVDDPSATVECQLDGGFFSACTSPQAYSDLSDGQHTFTVRATDAASNVASDSHTWTIDTAAPATTISDGPAGITSATAAEFQFSSVDPTAEFECRLDSSQPQDFSPCDSPKDYTGLSNGSHTFEVRATDEAGNVGGAVSRTWTVDTLAPTASITAKPSANTNETTAQLSFSSTEAGSTFLCRIDSSSQADYLACGGPGINGSKAYTDLGEGPHSFDVIAVDPAGNPSPAASHSWAIDTTAPTVTIDQAPERRSNLSTAGFTFSASEPGSAFQCRDDSDSAAFVSCTSPRSRTNLVDGPHSFDVRARDAVGNVGPVTSYLWTSDVTPPTVTFDSGPANGALTNSTSVSFAFHANEEAERECRLAGPGIAAPQFGPCDEQDPIHPTDSAFARSGLADGTYTLTVKATDAVGHVTNASRSWTIDATAPSVGITSGPSGITSSSGATFQFTATGGVGPPKCALDGGAPQPCSSPQDYVGLSEGDHTFTVSSVDDAGNQSSASRSWTVDLTKPETVISSGPGNPSSSGAATFVFGSDDGSASFQCSIDGSLFAACSSPLSYAGLGEGDHVFRVRALDVAGNVDGTPAAYGWRVVLPTATPVAPPTSSQPQAQVGGVSTKSCKRKRSKAKRRKCKAGK